MSSSSPPFFYGVIDNLRKFGKNATKQQQEQLIKELNRFHWINAEYDNGLPGTEVEIE